jgi:hypothetical protein
MRTVYKYPLKVSEHIPIPKGGKILSVAEQNGEIFLWVEVDTTQEVEGRFFIVYGTGWMIDEESIYVGTVHSGLLVWHIYEVK